MTCLPEQPLSWLKASYPFSGPLQVQVIDADGSSRSFYRMQINDDRLVLLYSPHNMPENMAWYNFNRHLAGKRIPVPAIVAAWPEAGMFLMRDMGETSLQEAVRTRRGKREQLAGLYYPVLRMLARLHATGLDGLDESWCFDSPALDAPFLRVREMGYFFDQVVAGYKLKHTRQLLEEFDLIANQAAAARPWGLAHRDMQSRNIVLDSANKPGLVDFQGARPGPVQYDAASLINDPYVDLAHDLRMELIRYYVKQLRALLNFDEQDFWQGLPWVALSRNLQTLAAYVFLSREKGKSHFVPYLAPASRNLSRLLESRQLSGLRHLADLTKQLLAIHG